MEITTHLIAGALGADVEGIDLCALDQGSVTALRDALDWYQVIRLRGQSLTPANLSSVARHFGPPFLHPIVNNGLDAQPDVLELTRAPGDATMFGGEAWHADITWIKPAGYVSILHALEVPTFGGDTGFASTLTAFERLSDGLKNVLRGLNAVHAYHWYEQREEPPFVVEHPVVRTHPVSKREGLYVNRMFTTRFAGMTHAESAPLLEMLFAHMEQHDNTCRFRWQAGDVLIWDNRFCLHYPINDFSGQRRRMIRTSTMED